jgi:hypothetical protein
MIGRFRTAPADNRTVLFVWSGDTAGQGWGINEAWGKALGLPHAWSSCARVGLLALFKQP